MTSSLVGSEMCIRDSPLAAQIPGQRLLYLWGALLAIATPWRPNRRTVSYTHLTLPTICSV
eukprot:2409483-Prorocentrum_lima.AAC.1